MEEKTFKTVFRIVAAALAVLFVSLIIALIVNLVQLSAVNARKQALAEQSAQLDKLIADNGQFIEYCGTAEFVEDYAREYLDMIYRGEIVLTPDDKK